MGVQRGLMGLYGFLGFVERASLMIYVLGGYFWFRVSDILVIQM